jgi:gliding motility-associated-like protein
MMRSRPLLITLLFLLFIVSALPAQLGFPCDQRLIVTLSGSMSNSIFYWVEPQNNGSVTFEEMVTTPNENFNALGYNIEDQLIYGWQRNTNNFVKIYPDGNFELVGSVSTVNSVQALAGDVSSNGIYVYYDQTTYELLFFDISEGFELLAQPSLYWNPATGINEPFTLRIDDLAIDPFEDGVAYTYQRNFNSTGTYPTQTRGQLLRIDTDLNSPTLGMVTPVGLLSPDVTRLMGSMFFNNKGQLFGYGSLLGFPDHQQNRLIAIDKETGDASLLGIGPTATQSDGCSCPYNIVFEKTVSQDTIDCDDTALSFTFTLISRHSEPMEDLELLDTLPGNMAITEVEGNFSGNIQPEGGVGSNIFHLTDLLLPAGDSISITITATASFPQSGTYTNQAYLFNLPSLFGESRASDNPQTIGLNSDPTQFEVLESGTVETVISTFPATDCQSLDSSRLVITSPSFSPDLIYEATLTFPNGSDTTIELSTTQDSSLVISNLPPGDYIINSVFAPGSHCPLVASTTATVPSPVASIDIIATNNSPVCSGETVQLNAEISGAETLSWSGPNGFSSQTLSPSLTPATPNMNGTYIITASIGFCQASDTTIVFVQPPIELSVDGIGTACEGETSVLSATVTGDAERITWVRPDGSSQEQDTLFISNLNTADEGEYTVVAQTGLCADTTIFNLTVAQPPIINLPANLTIDLCESPSLSAEVATTSAYTLNWSPAESLSCDNCLNPTIVGPPATSYTLTAVTSEGCQSSSQVSLTFTLDKQLYVPNAFSPNDDGRNDYFELFPGCGVERILRFQVYNRWGSLVFNAPAFDPQQENHRWNGHFRTALLNTSVFTWVIEVRYLDGTQELLSGDVQLVR